MVTYISRLTWVKPFWALAVTAQGGEMVYKEHFKKAIESGARHGLIRGMKHLNDEANGAILVVISMTTVIIGLYITAMVMGSMSGAATKIILKPAFNTTLSGIDQSAQSSYQLGGLIPLVVVGVGILGIVVGAFAMR
jgi:hypothetical protein